MMQYDTAGNPIIFYDQCAYCQLDTEGNHQSSCPLYQPKTQIKTREQLVAEIRECSHIKYGEAWQKLAQM